MIMDTHVQIKQGIEHYYKPKPAGDIDLINEVRSCLVLSGLNQRLSDAFDSNRFIVEALGKESSVQRHLLNRYWNQQLMSSSRMSIEERYCLIPNGTIGDWLDLFKSKVLPFVIENNLPIKI